MNNKHKWSKYQKAIFNDVSCGSGHTVVEATAGSGKTSTLLESLNYIPEDKTWLLGAFNKRIAQELARRAPSSYNGDIRTLHSLGLRALSKRIKNIKIESNKNRMLLDKIVGTNKKLWDLKFQISKCVSLCKGYLIEGDEFIDYVIDNHTIDTCEIDRDLFIHYVKECLKSAREETRYIDFDDMIWMPYVYDIEIQKYDRVFIDEAQDLNNAQIKLALNSCDIGGRIMALGDRAQGIYGFRGASLSAMSNIVKRLDAKTLPLSITYRCPKLIVKEAQQLVPTIEAAPRAKDGKVEAISKSHMLKTAKPGCFILSRANAPLVSLALNFIKNEKPAIILGKDIGDNLLNLIKKSKRRSLDGFLTWLDKWEKTEVARLKKKKMDTSSIKDKAACMRALASSCGDLSDIKKKIKLLFEDTDEYEKLILSTVHKAKGLEKDVVYMLMPTFKMHTQEERNIKYVAITRAAKELYYVSGK